MSQDSSDHSGVRLAELMAALSLATDLGMGQPMEFALSACILAVRLAEKCGYSEEALREVYFQALLRYIGCNAETDWLASIVGDEQQLRADFAQIDNGNLPSVLNTFIGAIRQANAGDSTLNIARAVGRGLLASAHIKPMFAGHCEVAQRLAERFGFDKNIIYGLGQLYERWDGKGTPKGLKGEAIAPAVLVVTLAQDMILFQRLGGLDAALNVARERKGGAYAPALVEAFCAHAEELCLGLDQEPSWESVLDLQPGAHEVLTEEQFEGACQAFADFVDIKSTYTLTHSSGVSDLAAEAARLVRLPPADVTLLRRAALLKEIGRTGISSSVWEKTAALSDREWEQVRLHTYYAERILARTPVLARLGALASLHHERLDGSGYHRGLPAASQTLAARILSAADVYHALTEARPHRPAFPPEAAAREVQGQVHTGKLDGEAVSAVLSAAGHRLGKAHRQTVAGLSEREVEVLRLLSRGLTIKQIALQLVISDKTVDSHIQHIYHKIGVSTRAGATMFAMEHQLL
ncbi:MAG TPA: HD domain-containing phosphohydrolase [Anaerolineales bacterium]|nr:HD domain-containing phosphohydrolase [Anaerolineales bacterium]